jgi:hypothetical protein
MSVKPANRRGGWWPMLGTGSVVLFFNAMMFQSWAWEPARALGGPAMSIWPYWSAFVLCWVVLSLLLIFGHKQVGKQTEPGAAWCVLFIAILARVVVVYATQPVLSDDIWRYIHDGAMLGQGNNPYLVAPGDLPADQYPVPQIVDRMNNTGMVTIYQPTSQYVFAGLDRVWAMSPDIVKQWDPNHDKVFRLGFVFFDMVLIGVILAWLRSMGRSPWWAVAYAWHPLAISEVAGSGHQDSIGIAFLVLALWLASKLLRGTTGPHPGPLPGGEGDDALSRKRLLIAVGAGVAFGLAVAVKPIVLPIALALAILLRRRPGLIAWAAGATVLTGAAVYLPLMLMEGGLSGMFETGRTFVDKWAFNGSAYPFAARWLVGKPMLDYLAIAVLLTVVVISSFGRSSESNPARPAGAFLLASLLLSSTVHPWYLLWALALMPMWFSWPMWVFCLTITVSYIAHINPAGYQVPLPALIGEYLPVYALLCLPLLHYFAIIRRARK